MSLDLGAPTQPRWPAASGKRLLLALYLDYLLLGAPWTIAAEAVEESWSGVKPLSLPLKLLFFLVAETILFSQVRWSPGQRCLGIVAIERTPFADPIGGRPPKPIYLVDPWLKANERWWTVLYGVYLVLDGAKAIARWTMWHAPLPFMGMQLSTQLSIAVSVLLGLVQWGAGATALRLAPLARPLGLALFGVILADALLSWRMLPQWIEHYVIARRAYQGAVPRPGEIEFMQLAIPWVTATTAIVGTVWTVAIGRRARRARERYPSGPTGAMSPLH